MKVEKAVLGQLDSCYAVSVMELEGKPWYFAASEGNHQPCIAYAVDEPFQGRTIWTEPGGCMTMVPVPGKPEEFLAIQQFYRLFQWEEAQVVWIWRDETGAYQRKVLVQIPYIHRIDVLRGKDELYFLGCSVSHHKESLEDWNTGGRVYTARVDVENRELQGMTLLRDDLYQNHGYCHREDEAGEYGLIGCAQGIFLIRPPMEAEAWQLEQIFSDPVSDMAMTDIDGDGVEELATIETFHGKYFRVYHRTESGWQMIFQHPEVTEFYHVVWGGTLNGAPAFVGGCRRGKQQLFLLTGGENGQIRVQTLDEDVGPSNVAVLHCDGGDVLLAANRECGQAAIYRFPVE